MSGPSQIKRVLLGYISGLMGVKGWVKIHSYTDPRVSIVRFERWIVVSEDTEQLVDVTDGRQQGRTIVAKIHGVDSRDDAGLFVGSKIFVNRKDLPVCGSGEYYWADLEGLAVKTNGGQLLGHIDFLFSTGEQHVMVVAGEKERLIPFVHEQVVSEVNLEIGEIIVDWDPTY
ncbi:MAG: 16S rRNA processing protein RimM [Rhodospirillaceae bacterium]|nr:16S rRNA processing protein RimM [Rhodospirillaceae bacterium]|tara:strand:- start:144 stop:659 length:516 start_codon:yes stop_codon:yes gene_type:complete